ncbi:vitamin K epoxide reductase family protein [Thermosynechococcaceae cyanobacterium BACA0444]|uniref:Vitamin K epoxide reductase family protein n=1 Tax=Pseudocalidococcus azoricus BACA0444 TaxID=2918990 RepID=A0AAE4FQN8_9CYAN|nr:vitamin K epoxide reductase family protein [Pseudocalidococcus azoricus]MDS3859747.1 vitamin K epoxide reductase family protein [Pseudocalidococcus azoricus BACA0444]
MPVTRRRSTPWLHRWSRVLIGIIAGLGMIVTGYLTIHAFGDQSVACPTADCDVVLSSPWAKVFGLPLALFGLMAYGGMFSLSLAPFALRRPEQKDTRQKLENITWLFLFIGAVAMTVFSGYLMYVLTTAIKAACLYCIASAAFSLTFLGLTLTGRDWPDRGQLFFTGLIVIVMTLIGTLGIYNFRTADVATGPGIPVVNTSGPAEMSLAKHLTQSGAVMYGAYWCSHCHDQKELFGKTAFKQINYVECDPGGQNPQPDLCRAKDVKSYPTWEIAQKNYSGTRPLPELADLSGYQGDMNFKN